MATPTYELGTEVQIEVDGFPYLGTVITYDENVDPIVYKISVTGLGNVISVTEDDIDDNSAPTT